MAKAAKREGVREGVTRREGRRPRSEKSSGQKTLEFSVKNYLILIAGIAVITVGYILLARGSITIAPVLLILGYCVIIPIAIIIK